MNAQEEAMAKIEAVLEQYYRGQISPYEALNQISRIKGEADMRGKQ